MTSDDLKPTSDPASTADPGAVRIALAPASAHADLEPIEIASGDGRLVEVGHGRVLIESDGPTTDGASMQRVRVLLEAPEPALDGRGVEHREIVVDGWRVEVQIESARHAELRERARRGRPEAGRGGPTEVRAIIPGRVVSVSVAPGDTVRAGGQLLVVEAMKMQNELRAPRDGIVGSVSVETGETIEIGDLLLVIE